MQSQTYLDSVARQQGCVNITRSCDTKACEAMSSPLVKLDAKGKSYRVSRLRPPGSRL